MFINFILENWHLFASLAAVVAVIAILPAETTIAGAKILKPDDLPLLQNSQPNTVLVDIRETKEFNKGHVIQSINIPSSTLSKAKNRLDKCSKSPIVIICQTGATASKSIKTFMTYGCDNLHVLHGGIEAWKRSGLPLEDK